MTLPGSAPALVSIPNNKTTSIWPEDNDLLYLIVEIAQCVCIMSIYHLINLIENMKLIKYFIIPDSFDFLGIGSPQTYNISSQEDS